IVADAGGPRLERREGVAVGLALRRVHASRRDRHLDVVPGVLRGFLDGRAAAENDQVGKRNLLAAGRRRVELLLDRFELLQHRLELSRLVDLPVLLRREADARAVRAATLVGAAESRRRSPGRRDKPGYRDAGGEDPGLESSNVLLPDQRMIDRRDRVL